VRAASDGRRLSFLLRVAGAIALFACQQRRRAAAAAAAEPDATHKNSTLKHNNNPTHTNTHKQTKGDPEVPDEEAEEAAKRTEPGDPDPEAPPGEPSEPEPGPGEGDQPEKDPGSIPTSPE
jgi:hypothetical protein